MKILNMRKLATGGVVKAFFDVDLERIIIRGFKLVLKSGGQTMWCSPPDEKYTGKDGKPAYKKIVEITDIPLIGKIAAAAVEEYAK